MAKGAKKTKKPKERLDRRFLPESTANPKLVYGLGSLGAILLGAGAFAQYGRAGEAMFHEHSFWILAAGAIVLAAAFWFTGGSDAAIRVGAPGISFERGGMVRIPWRAIEAITWNPSKEAFAVSGQDESGIKRSFEIRAKAHPQGSAWLLKEASQRVSSKLEVPEDVRGKFPAPDADAGTKIDEPLQVVGKRCAASDKTIAYEPDARICEQCERVYHKRKVPVECACGASLESLRDQVDDG